MTFKINLADRSPLAQGRGCDFRRPAQSPCTMWVPATVHTNPAPPLWSRKTNGLAWRVYRVAFTKPIDALLVVKIDVAPLDPKNEQHLDTLYLICKEVWARSVLGDYHTQKQALSRFFIGAMLLTDSVVEVVRRELRRVSPDVRIEVDQIRAVLTNEVIKREVVEGEKAEEARRKIARSAGKALRASQTRERSTSSESPSPSQPEPTSEAEAPSA